MGLHPQYLRLVLAKDKPWSVPQKWMWAGPGGGGAPLTMSLEAAAPGTMRGM